MSVRRVVVACVVALVGMGALAPGAGAQEPPPPPPGLWASIDTGTAHTCAVTPAGAAWCWGSDRAGGLGDGPDTPDELSAVPVEVATPEGVTWASVSAGGAITCAVAVGGDGWCWGQFPGNGVDTYDIFDEPTLVSGEHTWASISAGSNHACGVTTAGQLYCWGSGTGLGLGQFATRVFVPHEVTAPSGTSWASVSGGDGLTCATTAAGSAWCWGESNEGEVGNGRQTDAWYTTPEQVAAPGVQWASVAAGVDTACGIDGEGAAWCWGSNRSGALGDGSEEWTNVPVRVAGDHVWSQVAPGSEGACGVTDEGAALCWGDDWRGQVGDGTPEVPDEGYPVPNPVATPEGVTWASVSGGFQRSCATTTAGAGYCWGADDFGALGNDPVLVDVPGPARVRLAQVLDLPTVGTDPYAQLTLAVTASSGLTVTASATGPCTVSTSTSGFEVVATGTGDCTVAFSQAGSDTYAPVTATLVVPVEKAVSADEAWVDHAYEVLVGRPADAGGRDFWVAQLAGGLPRLSAARRIGATTEALRRQVIGSRYERWLGRAADSGALTYWAEALAGGRPVLDLEVSLLASEELHQLSGGTDAEWIQALFQNLLGRAAEPDALSYWTGRIATTSRRAVADALLGSAEVERNRVREAYLRILDRPADAGGLAYFAELLSTSRDLRTVEVRLVAAWRESAPM